MKKMLAILLVLCFVMSLITPAYADIFGQRDKKLKATEGAIGPQTILDNMSKVVDYLGAREGTFYDFNTNEFCNYGGATLYTYEPYKLSLNVGALNLDGAAATVDWNAGAFIPSENVPVMSLFKYLYIGGGLGARFLDKTDNLIDDKEWQAAYGADAQVKMTW